VLVAGPGRDQITDAEHTGGLAAHPREYERRVTSFFARALPAR
jgi:hypothetical protein